MEHCSTNCTVIWVLPKRMSAILALLSEFFLKLTSDIAASRFANFVRRNPFRQFTSKGRYLRDLEEKIRQMPFIYRDLDGQVYNDFVDIVFQKINPETYHLVPGTTLGDEYERLRRSKKILMLGSAGSRAWNNQSSNTGV